MLIYNVTKSELEKALREVNRKYKNNICWNRFESCGKGWRITLRVKDSKKAGHSLGYRCSHYQKLRSGKYAVQPMIIRRRLVSACWHVHGDFFDALLEINSMAIIKTRHNHIDEEGGNWEDYNTGSMMFPEYASERCDCETD